MKKILIAYFSRKGENYVNGHIVNLEEGNTSVVARMIKDLTNGDLFEIETEQEYSRDYYQTTKLAKQELSEEVYPDLKQYCKDLKDYDIIFIGYPNWWGTYPRAVASFLKAAQPYHQTIVPFCTHEGSGMGHSECDLKKVCLNCEIKRGFCIRGSQVQHMHLMVEQWIENILK